MQYETAWLKHSIRVRPLTVGLWKKLLLKFRGIINKPYDEVLGAAQHTKHVQVCQCMSTHVNACQRMSTHVNACQCMSKHVNRDQTVRNSGLRQTDRQTDGRRDKCTC